MRSTAFVASGLLLAASVAAQTPEQLKALRWRSAGPANNAGRVSVVAGVPGNRDVYYVAGANGGIIKTTNGGITFKPIFDKEPVASIGAIAVAPSDPNIIYVGTGEENPRNNASIGDGDVQVASTRGEHWTHIGLEQSDKIARIVVDAKNPDVVYACGLGREWGPNEERGVFKTVDGGKTWKKSALRRLRRPPAPTSRPTRATRTSSTPGCTRTAAGRGTSSRAAATRRCIAR